ncbi:uncharacterized protein N7498_007262 [Penicillium cinerascens]|uniref:Uncharacterized protein n=1 Tax=Penicillium cinerascens TaxID=70096 RepID=A0A9W9MD75_9EURO|nr:uncharacterized protein N7498_007262 [Penicillium cinerascens]KAJ5198145.1 hypothetical protein N7498_007262 [Penicillium cinerascens]
MKLNSLPTILALASSSPTAPWAKAIEKRNPTGPFSLVAYGIASSYIKILYSDVTTTATAAGVTLDVGSLFYIRPTEDAITSVGFTGNDATVPCDATSESFIFCGTYLMWEEFGGN